MARLASATKPLSSTLIAILGRIGAPEWRHALAGLGVTRAELRTMAPLAMAQRLVDMNGGAA
jgi:hypothetical protein